MSLKDSDLLLVKYSTTVFPLLKRVQLHNVRRGLVNIFSASQSSEEEVSLLKYLSLNSRPYHYILSLCINNNYTQRAQQDYWNIYKQWHDYHSCLEWKIKYVSVDQSLYQAVFVTVLKQTLSYTYLFLVYSYYNSTTKLIKRELLLLHK